MGIHFVIIHCTVHIFSVHRLFSVWIVAHNKKVNFSIVSQQYLNLCLIDLLLTIIYFILWFNQPWFLFPIHSSSSENTSLSNFFPKNGTRMVYICTLGGCYNDIGLWSVFLRRMYSSLKQIIYNIKYIF